MPMFDNDLRREVWRRTPNRRKLVPLMNQPFASPGSSFTTIGL